MAENILELYSEKAESIRDEFKESHSIPREKMPRVAWASAVHFLKNFKKLNYGDDLLTVSNYILKRLTEGSCSTLHEIETVILGDFRLFSEVSTEFKRDLERGEDYLEVSCGYLIRDYEGLRDWKKPSSRESKAVKWAKEVQEDLQKCDEISDFGTMLMFCRSCAILFLEKNEPDYRHYFANIGMLTEFILLHFMKDVSVSIEKFKKEFYSRLRIHKGMPLANDVEGVDYVRLKSNEPVYVIKSWSL